MKTNLPIELRPYRASDENFVVDTWLESYLHGSKDVNLAKSAYAPIQRQLILDCVDAEECVVAVNEEDDDQIFGYACFTKGDPTCLHYVYVKQAFRHLGIAKTLVPWFKEDTQYSHRTHRFRKWTRGGKGTYNPLILLEVVRANS